MKIGECYDVQQLFKENVEEFFFLNAIRGINSVIFHTESQHFSMIKPTLYD